MESPLKQFSKWLLAVIGTAVLFAALFTAIVPQSALAAEYEVADDPFAHGTTVDMPDGAYTVDVVLDGGSGRASVDSPAQMEVRDGTAAVTLQWSSPNYDYMVVDGLQYLPENTTGNSVFTIPVLAMDESFTVVGDTTAMSTPHEVEYQLTVNSASAKAADGSASASAASTSSVSVSAPAASASSASSQASSQQSAASNSNSSGNTPLVVVGIVAAVVVAGVVVYIIRGRRNRA